MNAISILDATQLRKARTGAGGGLAGHCARALAQDMLWMSRFDGSGQGDDALAYREGILEDWEMWRRQRQDQDSRLLVWAKGLNQAALEGEFFWFSQVEGRAISRPAWSCVVQLFTQQTEARGRICAELGHLGAAVPAGDLLALPDELDWM